MNNFMIYMNKRLKLKICLPHKMLVNGICNKTQKQSCYNILVV